MSVAKYNIEVNWKEFNVSLSMVEEWMKENAGEQYCGNSAGQTLQLWFLEEPSEEIKSAVLAYWDGLDEESDEATTYVSQSTISDAIQTAREDAVTKSWDNLSVAQKKLITGLTPTVSELGL